MALPTISKTVRAQNAVAGLLWVALLVSIPVTSSPWVGSLSGLSQVSPLAILPLLLLVPLWFIPSLARGESLGRLSHPLLLFAGIALLTTVLAVFRDIRPLIGEDALSRGIRGLLTLGAGMAFYLLASKLPRTENALRNALRSIYFGGFLTLAWATVQAAIVLREMPVPHDLNEVHRVFSMRDLYETRVTGLAIEPSWLANQLAVLYLPLWLASVVRGYSVIATRSRLLSAELMLFLWGTAILIYSRSRIGLLSFSLMLVVLSIAATWELAGRLSPVIVRSLRRVSIEFPKERWLSLRFALWIAIGLLAFMSIMAIATLIGATDPRMEQLLSLDLKLAIASQDPVFYLANKLAFAERVIYWVSGLLVFAQSPLLGVGLGSSGLLFHDIVPAYGYALPEIITMINGPPLVPNPKNIWIRTLAETGIVGFVSLIVWLLSIAAAAYFAFRRGKGVTAMLGLAGLLALAAQIMEGFSLDTFGLPQLWIILGLVSAAAGLCCAESSNRWLDARA